MGYSEILCHICGVSFNIGRIRTQHEPRNAAWAGTLEGWPYVVGNDDCHRDSGCMLTIRKAKDDHIEKDDAADGDWVPEEDEEDEDDEALEYVSDDGVDESKSTGDVAMGGADEIEDELPDRESLRQFWIEALLRDKEGRQNLFSETSQLPVWYRGTPSYAPGLLERPVHDEMLPLPLDDASELASDPDMLVEHKALPEFEHIAGPKCEHARGYSGISVQEMRSCRTAQCLVRKSPDQIFGPLPDDEDFERHGEFFLSGLTDNMPSRDYDCPSVEPPRHYCQKPHAENVMWEYGDQDYAMPFHPYCFEVFKRANILASGRVDVPALTAWWSLTRFEDFHKFPRDPDVFKCRDQEWHHRSGTAYLAANPLFVPRLSDILDAALNRSPDFSPNHRAFQVLGPGKGAKDPFNLLPVELQFEILDHLPPKDIASLRLSSRVFSELPVSYFQKIILREMPWLWEAWPTNAKPLPTMPYSYWATGTARDVKLKLKRPAYELAKLNDYVDIVKREMPELAQQVDEDFARYYEEIMDAEQRDLAINLEKRTPFCLPPNKTNYFTLYTLITRHWPELRGLQNRKRIWSDCQEILRRVQALKDEGIIDEKGVVGDLRDVFRQLRLRQQV